MLRKILLPVILAVLAYGFWLSPNFKEIAAGVAIFLFGMLFLEEGFKAFTGGLLERLLNISTDRQWKSVSFGIVTTSLMQSSSLVSVITISFLSAGLIGLAAGIGIIFGANIGTTTGAWLIAGLGMKVKIDAYAMPMLVFGIILVFQSSRNLKGVGYILAGLGFLFLGIHHMKEGFEAFRDQIDLAEYAMDGYPGLFLFTLIGTVATVIMQSSHATLVLIITALASGHVTYENALALAIGANIGTTITAILGSLSANFRGKQLAAAHLIFNVLTGVVAIAFIHQFLWGVETISSHIGIAHDDYTMKLAVFHSLFNFTGVGLMWFAVPKLVSFLERAIPEPKGDIAKPRYLDGAALEFPETIVEAVRKETLHLYENAFEIMAHGLSLHRHDIRSDKDLDDVIAKSKEIMDFDLDKIYVARVKLLYAAIVEFVSKAQTQVPEGFHEQLFDLRRACQDVVESVKDVKHLRKNVSKYIKSGNDDIRREYNHIRAQLGMTMRALHELQDADPAERDTFELESYKVSIAEDNIIVDGTLDSLIRDGRITASMATSLMNDLNYARQIVWNLADMGETLFGSKDAEEKTARRLMSLDEDDVEEVAQRNTAPAS